ncbi:MAG TPA: hypothetical protein VFR76_07115, partial [Verrucomicrobiae bacterium]|nr:hypothetical protein [Verrucomicrobiae bacterium]
MTNSFVFRRHVPALAALICLFSLCAKAQTPQWIWHPNNGQAATNGEVRFFRKTFTAGARVQKATLEVAVDNEAEVFLNGEAVATAHSYNEATVANVTGKIKVGENALAVRGLNQEGPAALLLRLEIQPNSRNKQYIVTDTSWQTSATEDSGWRSADLKPSGKWVAAVSVGKLGDAPWGKALKSAQATPAEQLTVLPGFKVELLHSAQPGEGSWVSMTTDAKGRLIISPQGTEPMLRITLDASGHIAKQEKIDLPVNGAMGLLCLNDSLYVNGKGEKGYHLYRLRDTNGDDQYDKVELLREWQGGTGEHGSHGIVLGPDKKLYTVCGNFVGVPSDLLPTSPHKNYADDLVLP